MNHYSFKCPQGHRQLETRLPKERDRPGVCGKAIGAAHDDFTCGEPTQSIYTRWDRFTDMLINLAKKVGL